MRKKRRGKRLKERGEELSTTQVTVADFANSDPAVVKSGRVRKAVANAIKKEVKSLCGLEASLVPVDDELTSCTVNEQCESSDDLDMAESSQEILPSGKKKRSRRHKAPEDKNGGDYPIDIWLMLASYIRPEDIVKFALICKNAWTVTCTAAFWMRLYRRHYHMNANLPVRLRPECIEKLRSLRACVIRSLYHMYEPFTSRLSKNPTIPESTPSNLANSKCMLFWCRRTVGNRQETMWEFNFKFQKQFARFKKSHHALRPPTRYEEVHNNPDQDCCLLQVTTLNFIFIPIVMGMTLSCFTINVSMDMRHHRVRLLLQDSPFHNRKKPRGDQGVQVVLDPVHSVRLLDWWHPQYPFSQMA